MLSRFLPLWCLLGSALVAESAMDIEERVLDLEAQSATLKSDLEATKSLAEQVRPNAFNPSISVVGDFVGQYGYGVKKHDHDHQEGDAHDHSHEFTNGVIAREIEFEFRADVDPYADALIALALEAQSFDHVDLHLEEAYVRLKPFGFMAKLGRFRTAVGRMSRIHLHNIPQITYPLAMQAFLGPEGFGSQGLSLNYAFNPTSSSAINFFLEGVMLKKLPMQEKGAEKMPSAVGHVWWHQELAPFHYLDIGASSVLGRKGKAGTGAFWLMGGDVHYSYLPASAGQNPLFLLGSEIFSANATTTGRWPIGNFTWAQIRLIGSSFFGVRYDLAPQEADLQKFQHALGGYLSYYTSEFLRFRAGYEHVMPTVSSFNGDHRFMLSMIFILGSHPVEPYFVNR